MRSTSVSRAAGLAAGAMLAFSCTPALLEYPVTAVDRQARPPAWQPWDPVVVRRAGLSLLVSPVGLDASAEAPRLRLTLELRNHRDEAALWTADPARFRLIPEGGPALQGLTVQSDRRPLRRDGVERLVRVPPGDRAALRLEAAWPGGPLPAAFLLELDPAPWGETLRIAYRARPRHVRRWSERLAGWVPEPDGETGGEVVDPES